jgi:hypothetical protein
MASEPDRLILSARERQVLADLEAALQQDAPDLEASLRSGRHRRMPRHAASLAVKRRLGALAPRSVWPCPSPWSSPAWP